MQTDEGRQTPWWERYASHRSPLLRFLTRERRAPTFLEKLESAESIEGPDGLNDLMEGARDLWRMNLGHLLPDPQAIKDAYVLRSVELAKAAAIKSAKKR